MSAKRFLAPNATEALKRIRSELGGDAIVLGNRETQDGIEITAIAGADFNRLPPGAAAAAAAPAPVTAAVAPTAPRRLLSDAARRELIAADIVPRLSGPREDRPATGASGREPALPGSGVAAVPPPPSAAPAATGKLQDLSEQVAEMRDLLSGHVAAGIWSALRESSPARAQLMRRLLNAGLSSAIVGQLLAELPPQLESGPLLDAAERWIERRLQTRDPFAMFDRGGTYAFLGPTGVGKTTTVAKIAARCVLRYGRQQVALLTTDTYRIGAQEQLRVFARILNLPVVSLRDSDDLQARLADLASRRIVLLDTAGVSQRDAMMVEQLEMIRQGASRVHRVLVMSATTATRTLDDVVEAHQSATGDGGVDAAVVTKLDEGMSLAPAVDCVLRHRLPLLFLCNGQRVPEDLFGADARYLAHRTVNPRGLGTTDAEESHVPALIADDLSAWTHNLKTA